jgi:hypothetical protein
MLRETEAEEKRERTKKGRRGEDLWWMGSLGWDGMRWDEMGWDGMGLGGMWSAGPG